MSKDSRDSYRIYGGPASTYSIKLRAVFRYRRIRHEWLVPQSRFSGAGKLGEGDLDSPLTRAGKGVVPVVQYPEGVFKSDSTPIMHELERLYSHRSIIHPHPGIAFLSSLIEDMADECLPFPMFYFRWTADAEWCGRRQMIGWNGPLSNNALSSVANTFIERQKTQLGAAAHLPSDEVLKNYEEILAALEASLQRSLFFFGTRPSFAEFGLFGQLSQCVIDPSLSSATKEKAVRVFQWTQLLDDASGLEGEWRNPEECLTDELVRIVRALAPHYFAMQESALKTRGLDNLSEEINGPGYRLKCLLDLKKQLTDLTETDRELIRGFLQVSECWEHLQLKAEEREKVVPILPQ
jgi:glutathione S-transferase